MVSMNAVYEGGKVCRLTHDNSGTQIKTDAPKDIGGGGSAFSPTDLMGAALASCILTTIAMYSERHDMDLTGTTAHTTKEMSTDAPRRVARLATTVTIPAGRVPADMRANVEKIGHTCPVKQSLHATIEAPIEFVYK